MPFVKMAFLLIFTLLFYADCTMTGCFSFFIDLLTIDQSVTKLHLDWDCLSSLNYI